MKDLLAQVIELTTLYIGMQALKERKIRGDSTKRLFVLGQSRFYLMVSEDGHIIYRHNDVTDWILITSVYDITNNLIKTE